MKNPVFESVQPNYRKNVLEITLREGRKISKYSLPFAIFRDHAIGADNRFEEIQIDSELGGHGVSFVLEDGSKGDFPADLVLYYCDPTYDWTPINQLKKALKDKLKASRLSTRVLADALNTSPAQVMRLLEENRASRQLTQLFQLAELAGYRIDIRLTRKKSEAA